MITIKDYALSRGKSIQAVHQQIKRKNNAAALEGHIHVCKINNRNVKCLDKEAVEILDASSRSTPSVIIQTDNSAIIEQMKEEREQLLLKIAIQANKISELTEWKAEASIKLAEAEKHKLLATNLQTENDKLQKALSFENDRRICALDLVKQTEEELKKYEKTIFGLYKKRG